ncbi:MAG: TonB-dependent receptor [Bacteroidales bacterium]|nr:TonB-dependent receptor [Bacteroidales bacterium]
MFASKNLGRILAAMCAVVLSVGSLWAQNISVTGKVVDKNNEPVIGAYVVVVGTTTGTSTGVDGTYTINAPANGTLQFTCIGYKTQEVMIAGRNNVSVILADDAEFLDETVIVGFGTQKKVNLTGAVTAVDVEKTFGSKPIIDVSKGLQGVVPGLTITYDTGDLGNAPTMRLRGTGSINGDNKPLILVDGVEVPDLSFVNPDNIKNISVLKDAASTSIYGSRAAWGVILITSKDGSGAKDKVNISYSNNFSWNQPMALPQYNITKDDVIAQLKEGILAQKNTDGTDIEGFGMYYKDLIDPISNWFDKYGGQDLGRVWQYGRDYEYLGGATPGTGTFFSYRVTDPNKELFKTAFQHSHNLNVNGNSGKSNYNIGLGYSKQNSTMRAAQNTFVERYNANLSLNTQVTKWLNVGAKMMYTEKDNSYPYGYEASSSSMNLIAYTMRFPAWFPFGISDGGPKDAAGNFTNERAATGEGLEWRHGNGYLVYESMCDAKDQYLTLGGNVKIDIAPGLSFYGDYTRMQYDYLNTSMRQPTYVANWWSANAPRAAYNSNDFVSRDFVKRTSNTYNAYFDYLFDIARDNHFALKVGFNAEDLLYNYHWMRADGVQNVDIPTINLTDAAANNTGRITQNKRDRATAGFFGRINYNYKEKYLLELNGRYDGSSSFRPGKQWAFFASGSAGYKISEEDFWEPIKPVIPMFKIRASYGSVGNQALSSWYPYIATISKTTASWLTANNGNLASTTTTPSIVNSDMTWEKIRTLDIGFDAAFLNKDLNVTFDWFQRENIGMLLPGNELVRYTGIASAPLENAGNLRTRGWELEIDYNHAFNKDFAVYGTFTISDSKAVITKWNRDAEESGILLTGNYEGKILGEIWGFETDRYWTSSDSPETIQALQGALQVGNFKYGPGDIKFKDLDGNGVIDTGKGTIKDHGDLIRIGNELPRYEYALRLGAIMKGFDFEVLFQGVGKRSTWTYSSLFIPHAAGAQMNIFRNELDYWTPENQNAKFPRPFINASTTGKPGLPNVGNNNFYPQTKYLQNLAYLRLKNLTIGYTIPQNFTQQIGVEKFRIYFSAFNLLTFDKIGGVMDPELTGGWSTVGGGNSRNGIDLAYMGRAVPYNRQWSCGVQITF